MPVGRLVASDTVTHIHSYSVERLNIENWCADQFPVSPVFSCFSRVKWNIKQHKQYQYSYSSIDDRLLKTKISFREILNAAKYLAWSARKVKD